MKKLLIPGFLILCLLTVNSQSLSDYQWKNRLIVVLSESADDPIIQEQFTSMKKDLEGFNVRKLLLIHAVPGRHQKLLPERSVWQDSEFYKQLKDHRSDFEIILIGLDGGVKLRQPKPVEIKKLFNLIDSMPMRKAEMKNRQN